MSGICGIIRFDGIAVKREEMQKMLDAMKNRGSDAEGIWVDENVGFGHKMLWTTPESLHENQPLVNQDENLVLTADARIDNREELIGLLEINNNESNTVTDADLILWAYEKWGKECSKYLMGDFAFAIWDKHQQELFCTRDRFGIKSLYFYFNNEIVYFSSDIDLLHTLIGELVSVNDNAIKSFARFGTIGYEETMYQNIFRIPPVYSFIFSKEGIDKHRYWFPEKIKINYSISFEEAKQEVYNLLSKAVISRLRVYGDWGCELSGGLDSTAISLIAKKTTNSQFKTFSMRYQSYTCDEWKYTKEAIDALGSIPIVLDVDELDVKNKYSLHSSVQLNKHWPLYGSFVHNYALGQKMLENDIRVCLTGHGGDHVFTGGFYPILDYLRDFRFQHAMHEFSASNESFFGFFYRVTKASIPDKVKYIIKKYLLGREMDEVIQSPENFTDYWNISLMKSSTVQTNLNYIVGKNHVMHTDNNYYRVLESSENIEFRHPFFDTKLVEYLLALPNYYKYQDGTIKVILRESLKDIYPHMIYNRQDKAEFSEALHAQMDAIDMEKVWKDSLLLKNDLINKNNLYELLNQYQNKTIKPQNVGSFWRWTTLELWLKSKV